MAVDPEQAGLCGCWQFVAVWRQRQKLRQGKVIEASEEYAFYVTSLVADERNAEQIANLIRDLN